MKKSMTWAEMQEHPHVKKYDPSLYEMSICDIVEVFGMMPQTNSFTITVSDDVITIEGDWKTFEELDNV